MLTADLGFKLFDNFKKLCPERFYDIGVAEANMISIAAGLSLTGKNVYCYSIIPFLIMRAYEQIRIDIAYHNLNVKLIGVGGGFTYGLEGFTHFGIEDFALMRTLPNMTVVVPADLLEAERLAKLSVDYEGPLYIRLGKRGDPAVHEKTPDFKIGTPITLKEGKNIAVFAIGSMVYTAQRVVSMLEKKGIMTTLVNMHTLKPLDSEFIRQIADSHEALFSIEEHYVDGGLGTAIAEVLSENNHNTILKRFGVDALRPFIGHPDFLREKYGLSVRHIHDSIVATVDQGLA